MQTSTSRGRVTVVPPLRQIEVLVADDDPIVRSLLSSQLRQAGVQPLEAADGAAAWKLIRDCEIDFAIVDLEMPGLDGMALVQCLRTHPRTEHIPIIMCTSHADLNTMNEAIGAGVSAFLTKPVNWSLFVPHMRHLLNMSRSAREAALRIDMLEAALAHKDAEAAALLREMRDLAKTIETAAGGPTSSVSPRVLATALAAMRAALGRSDDAYSAAPSGNGVSVAALSGTAA